MAKSKKKVGRGGKRPGSGAKPKDDPTQPITLYVKESIIEKKGGKEKTRTYLYARLGQRVSTD